LQKLNIMSINLLNKYVWLVETIYKNKYISLEDINKKWLEDMVGQGRSRRIYSLDRIVNLTKKDETFVMPKDWDADEYFSGCFGVIPDINVEKQAVKLKVSWGQANYIRDLPLHESQKETRRNNEYSIFTYYLRPTFDFQQELLWNGEDMEVIEPKWLRKEMAGKIKRMWKKYKEDK
jgi:predicted DNA-binding transcriptional regulator YafY